MGTLAEVVAQAKTGLWQLLRTTPGLTEADGVRVSSAVLADTDFSLGSSIVELGGVLIGPSDRPDLVGRAGAPTVSGWVTVTTATGGEIAIQSARDLAAELVGLVEKAVAADPTANGTVPGPGGTTTAVLALEESPGDWKGQAVRRARYPFQITWTSHIA